MGAAEESLTLEMHFVRDLMTTGTVEALAGWLATNAPKLSATLEVHAHERDPERIAVDLAAGGALLAAVADRGLSRGQVHERLVSTYGAAQDESRRFGSAMVRGRGRGISGTYLTIDFDSWAPLRPIGENWLWSNSVSASVATETVEGVPRATWIRALGDSLARDPDFLWGAAYVHSEFEAFNLDTTAGLRAIGRDASRHLPGLYWLNYFGPRYTPLMRIDEARTTGVGTWSATGDAAIFECYAPPERWQSASTDKRRVVEALGADLFFDRRLPDRPTRAPDFGVPPGPRPAKTFQVFTSDGINYTELPPS